LRDFGFLLKAVTRLTTKNFEYHARDLGLDMALCKVLVYLARSEGITQTQLSDTTETAPMTLVRILDRMESDEWIERRPDPADRRVYRLHLTARGRTVVEQVLKIADRARDEIFSGMGAADRTRLIELMEQVHARLLDLVARQGQATQGEQ
jgi:DNA-binding MarR family transcriptional regulator